MEVSTQPSQPKPNGLAPFSPGLPQATLGNLATFGNVAIAFKPQRGFARTFELFRRNPVGVEMPIDIHRAARSAQPYAGGRNAVGVEIKQHTASHQYESRQHFHAPYIWNPAQCTILWN